MTTLTLPLGMTAADSGSDSPPASDCDTVSIGLSNSRDAADQIPFSLSEASFALYRTLGLLPASAVPPIAQPIAAVSVMEAVPCARGMAVGATIGMAAALGVSALLRVARSAGVLRAEHATNRGPLASRSRGMH